MHLHPEWRAILAHAWSIRLLILAGLLSGLEAALPLFPLPFAPAVIGVLTLIVVGAAFVARLVAQKEFTDGQS
jgi:hypothetical protein